MISAWGGELGQPTIGVNFISTSKEGQGGGVQGVQGVVDGKAEGFEDDGDPCCWQS